MKSKAVCILGMHRSGTSAISRTINLVGAYLGEGPDLMPAHEQNPEGFWERNDVVDLHNRLLCALGRSWDSVLPLPGGWLESPEVEPFRAELKSLISAHMGDKDLWAWKDPRTCLLLPLWKEVLADLGTELVCIFVLRNPLDIAKSLATRNGFSQNKSLGIWFNHIVSSLKYLQGVHTCFLSYDLLLSDRDNQVERLIQFLSLDSQVDREALREELDTFLKPGLRHSFSAELPKNQSAYKVQQLYGALLDGFEKPNGRLDSLIPLAVELGQDLDTFSGFIEEDWNQATQTGHQLSEQNAQLVEREKWLIARGQQLSEKDQQLSEKDQQLSEKDQQLSEKDQQLSEKDQQISVQQLELDKLARLRLEHLRSLEMLGNELQTIYHSRSWRLTRPLRWRLRTLQSLSARGQGFARFVANFIKTTRTELQRHGVTGFARRLPFYIRRYRDLAALIVSRPPASDGALFDIGSRPAPRDIRLHPELVRGSIESIDHSVSVVIPTLNAGPEFRWLLRKLRAQKGIGVVEIVIVDSGSTDDTLEFAREADCTLVQIAPQDFSHSHARNIGADAASGDYLLFMVQDAYPIGNYWMHGILRYLLDHASESVVGASCSEYSRTDSDMMYDSMINTHYKFLGCLEYDRIGEYQGDDHMSLRSHGQLSDVSCMIQREFFGRYRYRGDYAEDLDLGIRLIKDGHRVAMLASVKVIHSHNRSSHYYLKRSFVDVVFLVDIFKDFTYPSITSVRGLLVGIVSVAIHLSEYYEAFEEEPTDTVLHEDLSVTIKSWRKAFEPLRSDGMIASGDAQLDAYVRSLDERFLETAQTVSSEERQEARRFLDSFLARLEHFNAFAAGVYLQQDTLLRGELRAVIRKTFAATAGSALGFMCIDFDAEASSVGDIVEQIKNELKAGI